MIEALDVLADLDHQKRFWARRAVPNEVAPKIPYDEVVHVLFDDTEAAEDPQRMVGDVLRGPNEADELAAVVLALIHAEGAATAEAFDMDHLGGPEWRAVVGSAQHALKTFGAPCPYAPWP